MLRLPYLRRFFTLLLLPCLPVSMAWAQKSVAAADSSTTNIVVVSNPGSSSYESLQNKIASIVTNLVKNDARITLMEPDKEFKVTNNLSAFYDNNSDLLQKSSISQVYLVSIQEQNNSVTAVVDIITIMNDSVTTFRAWEYKFKKTSSEASDTELTRGMGEHLQKIPAQGLSAEDGASTESIHLTWHHIPGRDTYSIFRAENESGPFERLGSTNTNSFMDTTAIPGREYFYSIPVIEKTDLSIANVDNSSIERGYRKLSTPQPVANEECLDKLVLTWDPVPGAVHYQVHRYSHEKRAYVPVATTKESRFIDRTIDRNTVCHYKVTAWASTGPGDTSPMVTGRYTQSRDGMVMRGIIPGWGQFYRHDPFRGFLYSGLFAASGSALAWSVVNRSNKKNAYDEATSDFNAKWNDYKNSTYLLWGFTALTSLIYIANWVDILLFNDSMDSSTHGTISSILPEKDKDVFISFNISDDKKSDMFSIQITRYLQR